MCIPDHEKKNLSANNHLSSLTYGQQYQAGNEMGGTVPDSGPTGYSPASVELNHPPPSPSPMANIPSVQKYTGSYGFEFDFGTQPKDTKSTAWTYSKVTNKLYAQKDAMCPVGFRVNTNCSSGLYIRALPLYSRPEYVQEVVKRCPNHVHAPESANIPHKEHFVWCEHQSAQYIHDPNSSRYAVRVPVDAPPVGTPWITYLFSFKCLNSCVGGPNRREMTMVFTLENLNQEVLGRQSFDLRICACPGRDRKTDENRHESRAQMYSPPTSTQPCTSQQPTQTQPMKRALENETYVVSKRNRPDTEVFNLSVKGKRNYEILCRIRDSLEISDQLVTAPERERFIQQRRQNEYRQAQPTMQQPHAVPMMPQRIAPISSSFTFTNALHHPQNRVIKQDVVDSTQPCRGAVDDYTDGGSAYESVSSWLDSIKLSAYTDNFHNAGFHSMNQLMSEQNFTMKDLENMNLTKPTVSLIWCSLKKYRENYNNVSELRNAPTVTLTKPEPVVEPDSQGSVVSLNGGSQVSGKFNPPMYEVTRCSLKFTVLKKPGAQSQNAQSQTSSDGDSNKSTE